MAEKKKAAKPKKAASKTRSRKPKEEAEGAVPARAKRAAAKPKVQTARVASEADEFRAKTPDELSTELSKLKKEQFNLRFQRANGQLEKTNRVRVVRKDIARILTIMNERRRAAELQGT